ncbi:MAG: AHH domain-containing protein [Verrucomicrobia bacterium]|nr:AHH domain-containing protein [Verrucomicrobiota bacterium]
MELLEAAIRPKFIAELNSECPFQAPKAEDLQDEQEDIFDDDRESVQAAQAKDGGSLGKNLGAALYGRSGTVHPDYNTPQGYHKQPREDSSRPPDGSIGEEKIWVRGVACDYTVAAHHLIPGNAALYNKRSAIRSFMVKDGEVTSRGGKKYTIEKHIGYNVNGAHNGVWLPGNYAYNAGRAKVDGKSWKEMESDWQLDYVAAAVKRCGAQFHDTHKNYSAKVLEVLNRMASDLSLHFDACSECIKKSGGKTPPPYRLIKHLYRASGWLRKNVLANDPCTWSMPFITSKKWQDVLSSPAQRKEYVKAWREC